jgi:anaerobic ribonucleoside-triphosphate reductase activating protein
MPRVSRVHYPVTALGPGRRLGIWFQGCSLGCRGCLARDTWAPGGGREVLVSDLADLWRAALADGADGLTVSGGEPLDQPAELEKLLQAAHDVRQAADGTADLLVYTGYEASEITSDKAGAIALADTLVTGRERHSAGAAMPATWTTSVLTRLCRPAPTPETCGSSVYRTEATHAGWKVRCAAGGSTARE